MRGKDSIADRRELIERITPAYAGKSHFALPNKVCIWDHPRLCGEKDRCGNCRNGKIGSPPPMRGKVLHFVQSTQRNRITPAYAGKSDAGSGQGQQHQDHPRLCGEKGLSETAGTAALGSPPPMRGKVPAGCRFLRQLGITPAYAGKSYVLHETAAPNGDHPRLCGEKATEGSTRLHR